MGRDTIIALAITASSTAVIALSSSLHAVKHWRKISSKRKNGYEGVRTNLYEDEDGIATEESEARYSTYIQKVFILLGAAAGIGFSLPVAIRSTGENLEYVSGWLIFVSWCFIAVRAVCVAQLRDRLQTFYASCQLAGVSFLLFISQLVLASVLRNDLSSWIELGLVGCRIIAAFILVYASLSIPRRPDVFFNGKKVDEMRSVSLISRYTYRWASALLGLAFKKGRLEEEDLPALDSRRRAHELQKSFNQIRKSPKLYYQIAMAHWRVIVTQWTLSLASAVCTFAPQYIMFQILKSLEKRGTGFDVRYETWFWLVCLGLTEIFAAVVSSYLSWLSFVALKIPICGQLSAVIFSKTIRKKDVKGMQKGKETESEDAIDGANKAASLDGGDDLKGMKQGIINLLAIDSSRVAEFAAFSWIFPQALSEMIFGFSLLIMIIGWKSLVAGLMVAVITTPFNIIISKKYGAVQDSLMKVRDRKIAVISEALQGIRQIKFSALETQWEGQIRNVRNEELKNLRMAFVIDAILILFWIMNSVLLSAVALSTYAIINGALSPSVAFTALAVFDQLQFVLSVVPELTTNALDAYVSTKRIKEYLDSAEKSFKATPSKRIAVNNATIAWAADTEDQKDRFCLRDVNLDFPINELSVISGRTGSGKSLLLASLLGEADVLGGEVEIPLPPLPEERFDSQATPGNWILPSAVAYVAQIPWIENTTIRDNILFGLPYVESRYKQTLLACALQVDLDMLPDGELTEIGANGINLSGGQRCRVSFARAVYSRAGILILDDIFSAVDAHVGKHLFENALVSDLMHGRTRILVTHHLKLCISKAKYTVSLANGIIEHAGLVEELKQDGALDEMIAKEENNNPEPIEGVLEEVNGDPALGKGDSKKSQVALLKFVLDEERERGAVKGEIYLEYFRSSGGFLFWALIVFSFLTLEAIILSRSYWLKMWTAETLNESVVLRSQSLFYYSLQRLTAVAQEERSLFYWIGVYTGLSIAICITDITTFALTCIASLRASRILFEKMTFTIMRTPLRWLDTVPTGRILNRFSKDFERLDFCLANNIAMLVYYSLVLIGVTAAGVILSRWMLFVALFLLSINIIYALYYIGGAREVRRLESNSRSPIFEFFGSTLSGVGTIRAFGKSQEYIDKMFTKIDVFNQRTFYVLLFNQWLGLRISVIGGFFAVLVGVVIIALPNIDASLAGFALSFALSYTVNVISIIQRYATTELDMNSAERIVEYTKLVTEDTGGMAPPAAWPHEGRIEFKDLVVRYAPELPPVLKGISFDIKPRERIGVVGRTGAGKSSMTLALFQFIRASSGSIHIDGLDISKVALHDLRSRLAIIPQDPVLFSGTVRSNLDTFEDHTDQELRDALDRVHLTKSSIDGTETPSSVGSVNSNIFENLGSGISEGGLDLSQGQRQLLCLARAIVSRPKILILDEATSAVDMETDALIQRSIREEFTDCTTLVIAHRLQTVADYDRILVLGDGKVLEYDSPWNLIQSNGVFHDMAQQSGDFDTLVSIAKNAAGGE